MEAERKIIISIETAFGGSVSVLDHGNEIDFDRSENRKAFGAEELLARISRVLKRNRIRREQIGAICISKGAASQTTEKIGLAISKGLSRAYGCQLIEVPILEALLLNVKDDFRGRVLVAVSTGANRVFWQSKEKNGTFFYDLEKPSTSAVTEFQMTWNSDNYDLLILLSTDAGSFLSDKNPRIHIKPDGIAELIGRTAINLRV